MAVVVIFKSRKSVYPYTCCMSLIPTRKRKTYNCKRYFFNLFFDITIFGDCPRNVCANRSLGNRRLNQIL